MRLRIWQTVSGLMLAVMCTAAVPKQLLDGQPISEAQVTKLIQQDSKNATYYELLEAFALLRNGNLEQHHTIPLAKSMLERAVSSFDDLRDPDNFSVAFTADPKTLYRGRPHERVMAAVMLAVIDMTQGRYDMAMPTLRNAEFLGVRWQAISYASTAPLVYALMLRATTMAHASNSDVERAKEGLYRSLRLNLALEPFAKAYRLTTKANMRPNALAVRVAEVIFDAALGTALMLAPKDATAEAILKEAVTSAEHSLPILRSKFEDVYKEVFLKIAQSVSAVEGDSTPQAVESDALNHVGDELRRLAAAVAKVVDNTPQLRRDITQALARTKTLAAEVERAATGHKMVLHFTGRGPKIVREGQYKEITTVVPVDASEVPIEEKSFNLDTSCGIHRGNGTALTVVLCPTQTPAAVERITTLELWSSSYQATSVVGRAFNSILKGRAQFRATTENIATIGGITALALLQAGSSGYGQCRGENAEACRRANEATMAAGAIVGAFAGVSYLVGRATNPEADPRYVPTLFEHGYVGVQQ